MYIKFVASAADEQLIRNRLAPYLQAGDYRPAECRSSKVNPALVVFELRSGRCEVQPAFRTWLEQSAYKKVIAKLSINSEKED